MNDISQQLESLSADKRTLLELLLREEGFDMSQLAKALAVPSTPEEKMLAEIWCEVLGVKQVGIHDDFFELGGDSFKVIHVAKKVGNRVTVLDIFQMPTIYELAAHIQANEARQHHLLHRLTPGNGELALICVPYAGGNAYVYQPLAAVLPTQIDLYALELPGREFSPPQTELLPIEIVAQQCLEEIQSRIAGPVALYGHCAGVALTLEIARLLEISGRKAETVFLGGALLGPDGFQARFSFFVNKVIHKFGLVTDARILAYLNSLGGFLGDVDDPAILTTIINSFRHDSDGAAKYLHFDRPQWSLETPIICLIGDEDPVTAGYKTGFEAWRAFSSSVSLEIIPGGGHYFIKHQAAQVSACLDRHLCRRMSAVNDR